VAFALFEEVDGLLGDARVNQTRDGSAASPDAMSISDEDEDDEEDGDDGDGPRVQEEEGNFRGFFANAICTALAMIWPDCEELAIARFLARKKHYTALLVSPGRVTVVDSFTISNSDLPFVDDLTQKVP
jgi:hypothetical protein